MASFKAKFPVLQELFAKNHRGGGALWAAPPAGRGLIRIELNNFPGITNESLPYKLNNLSFSFRSVPLHSDQPLGPSHRLNCRLSINL